MPSLVTTQEQATQNIMTLRQYRDGNDQEKAFHDGLIRRGRLFVVGVYNDQYAFAPSRFAGYKSNTMRAHMNREVNDGKITNPALDKIFGRPIDENSVNGALYKLIDREFDQYCDRFDITPADIPNPRKYWITEDTRVLYVRRLLTHKKLKTQDDAIDDLGSDIPDTRTYFGKRYSRDQRIRSQVLLRARGMCEYCKEPGFKDDNGEAYLECHHIIALSNDGADRMTNVIALCPNDHREAHFGKQRLELEKKMIQIIRKITHGKE